MNFITQVTILSFVLQHCSAARILGLFPVGGRSHFVFNEAIVKSLWEAGHHITMVSPFPQPKPLANFTDIDFSKDVELIVGNWNVTDFINFRQTDYLNYHNDAGKNQCNQVLSKAEIQQILNSDVKQYDVVITEILLSVRCFFPLARKLGIPVIGVSTIITWSEVSYITGNPENPAFVPSVFSDSGINMNFYQRMRNVGYYLVWEYYQHFVFAKTLKQIYEEHFEDLIPEMMKIEHEMALIFTNGHPGLIPRPNLPNHIEVGGIHIRRSERSLPQNIKKFIDEAKHGVLLFTFGSIFRPSNIKPEVFEAFKNAFAEIPQRVLWKYDDHSVIMPKNVMAFDWLPQRDILGHKNVKAFISHCGQTGMYEAIYTATPIIAVPLFADQGFDAALLDSHKVAIRLNYDTLNKDDVLQAINQIINNTTYAENMQRLSNIVFKDQPMSPQDSVVYWTEYVIRHKGASHLRSVGSQLPWYQYFLLDVIAVVLLSFTLIVCSVFYILKRLMKLILTKRNIISSFSCDKSELKKKL